MTTTKTAYWLNGTPYCVECVEFELDPCLSEEERKLAKLGDGTGRCGCCGTTFEVEPEKVYVVRDASGEYVGANGKRTPASNEAAEFETREEAQAACDRATDKVLERDAE